MFALFPNGWTFWAAVTFCLCGGRHSVFFMSSESASFCSVCNIVTSVILIYIYFLVATANLSCRNFYITTENVGEKNLISPCYDSRACEKKSVSWRHFFKILISHSMDDFRTVRIVARVSAQTLRHQIWKFVIQTRVGSERRTERGVA